MDLYSSYGLTQKAIDLLEIILQRAPGHAVALERLLDLYLGMGDDGRTVELATQLQRIYAECGDQTAADRFADLRRRFERTAAQAPQEAPPATARGIYHSRGDAQPEAEHRERGLRISRKRTGTACTKWICRRSGRLSMPGHKTVTPPQPKRPDHTTQIEQFSASDDPARQPDAEVLVSMSRAR